MNSVAYTWWGDPPVEWSGIRKLTDELTRLAVTEARHA
jgi:hypothetical protein